MFRFVIGFTYLSGVVLAGVGYSSDCERWYPGLFGKWNHDEGAGRCCYSLFCNFSYDDFKECDVGGRWGANCDHYCHEKNSRGTSCSCRSGYYLGNNGRSCYDTDECKPGGKNLCVKSEGSKCKDHNGGYTCTCDETPGFERDTLYKNFRQCKNINECHSNPCHQHASCEDQHPIENGVTHTCTCNPGYTGNGVSCRDINECTDSAHPHGCHAKAICGDEIGKDNTCTCIDGYRGDGDADGSGCTNINECDAKETDANGNKLNDCHADADCTDTDGRWTCACSTGYYDIGNGDGLECDDIDECAIEGTCDPNATCTNTIGSYYCDCIEDHQGEGHACTECSVDASWTTEGDVDAEMTAVCTCNTGYEGDGNDCPDVDECERGTHTCDPNATCTNTIGSFTCACNEGFYGFGLECSACDSSTDFTDMEISCDTSGIQVTIPYCAFWNVEITSQTFKEGGENCTIENTGVDMKMRIPATSECGTEVTNNGTYLIYSNAILGQVREHNDPITRRKFLELEFSCGFEADQVISMNDSLHAMIDHVDVDFGRQDETFDIYMGVFTDDTFTDVVPDDYTITVPEKIYAGVALRNGEDALVLKMQKCWATPTSDPEDADGYVFIDDFCSTQSEYEGILTVLENGAGKDTKFALESFEFLGHLEGTLYLHCHANVCDTELGDCDIDCSNNARRRRRSVGALAQPKALRVGPIRVIPAQ